MTKEFAWIAPTLIIGMLLTSTVHSAAEEISVPVSTGEDITIERYKASGEFLMLWLAPEYGFRATHRVMAQSISEQNIEVWQSNIIESLFLPQGTSSIKQLDASYVSELILHAHQLTGKKIIVSGDSYAALNVLEGIYQWQLVNQPDNYLVGAVLFTPYTFSYIPPLGKAPEYMPIVSATNIPVMIFQAKNSPIFNQFNTLLGKLNQHNSAVYSKVIPEVMSLFYEQPATRAMISQSRQIPELVKQMITVLDNHDIPKQTVPVQAADSEKSGIDIYLRKFKGNLTPSLIKLPDINGKTILKTEFTDKITLINFWATWCPPCIEEIPSLNRLKKKMQGQPFELISINYAEDPEAIRIFMQKVKIDFPVLLDQNGELAKKWNVISYPSTFVIDTNGIIRYGVNAAIEWDSPELIEKLKSLY